jgi:O-antigen ligase
MPGRRLFPEAARRAFVPTPWDRLDRAGLALVGLASAWWCLTSVIDGGTPAPGVLLLLGCVLAYVVARSARVPAWAFLALGAEAVLVVAIGGPQMFGGSPAPLAPPIGYANATAAALVQAAIGSGIFAALAWDRWSGKLALAAAFAFAGIAASQEPKAAAALLLVPVALGLSSRGERGTRVAIVLSAILVALTVAGTVEISSLAASDPIAAPVRTAQRIFSHRRLVLWHEAVQMIRSHPVTGVGPGRFGLESPTARLDADAAWAHSDFLQQGAEQGVIGLGLMVAIVGWGFARLWATAGSGWVRALGAAALAATTGQGAVDHVLRFPAVSVGVVLLLAGAVAAAALDGRSGPGSRTAIREGRRVNAGA